MQIAYPLRSVVNSFVMWLLAAAGAVVVGIFSGWEGAGAYVGVYLAIFVPSHWLVKRR